MRSRNACSENAKLSSFLQVCHCFHSLHTYSNSEHNSCLSVCVIFYTFPAAPNPEIENIEERNEDISDLMDAHGEEFEFADSDFEEGDEELEFIESFT